MNNYTQINWKNLFKKKTNNFFTLSEVIISTLLLPGPTWHYGNLDRFSLISWQERRQTHWLVHWPVLRPWLCPPRWSRNHWNPHLYPGYPDGSSTVVALGVDRIWGRRTSCWPKDCGDRNEDAAEYSGQSSREAESCRRAVVTSPRSQEPSRWSPSLNFAWKTKFVQCREYIIGIQ